MVGHNGRRRSYPRLDRAPVSEAVGSDLKGKISLALYLIAIALAFVQQNISHLIYVAVAVMWFIPDKRIELPTGPVVPGLDWTRLVGN